jgi:DNA primase
MGEKGRAIVVEGYLDVIACHEAGFPETVATMGTALTPEHVEQLRRRVNELVLAFDADSAGLSAAMRTRELFRQAGIQVLVVDLPEGADPDRVVRDGGPEAFSRLVSAATPMTEWELRRVLVSAPVSKDGAQKPEALQEAVSVLARLPEGVEREYYTRWLAREAGDHSATGTAALERAIRAELSRSGTRRSGDRRRTVETTAGEREPTPREMEGVESGRLQRGLLAALLHAPEMAVRYLPALEPEDFTSDAERGLFTALRARLQDEEEVTVQALLREVEPDGRRLLAELTVAEVLPEHMEEHIEAAIRRLQEARLQRQEAILLGQLEAADLEADRQELRQRISECRRQRSALAGKRLWDETDSDR